MTYKRSIQPQPYESEGAEVEVTFALEDDEDLDTVLANLLKTARTEVLVSLRLKKRSLG